jgi:hypothetical protein
VEANSTGGQGSRRAVAPSDDDDDDDDYDDDDYDADDYDDDDGEVSITNYPHGGKFFLKRYFPHFMKTECLLSNS